MCTLPTSNWSVYQGRFPLCPALLQCIRMHSVSTMLRSARVPCYVSCCIMLKPAHCMLVWHKFSADR